MKNADKDREKTICLCFSSWFCREDENLPVAVSPREFRFVTAEGNIPEAPVEIKKEHPENLLPDCKYNQSLFDFRLNDK